MNEESYINGFLAYLLEKDALPVYRAQYFTRQLNIDNPRVYEPVLRRVISEGLIVEVGDNNNRITLTQKGKEVAEIGYIGWLRLQRQALIEQETKEKEDRGLARSGHRLNKLSAIIGLICMLIAGIATYISYKQYNDSQKSMDDFAQKLQQLEQRHEKQEQLMQKYLQDRSKREVKIPKM